MKSIIKKTIWVLLLASFSGNVLADKNSATVVHKCSFENVKINSIEIVSVGESLFDSNGKSVTHVDFGFTDLFVAEGPVALTGDSMQALDEILSSINKWGKNTLAQPEPGAATVGLEIKADTLLFRYKTKWFLVRIFSDYIEIFEAEKCIFREDFKAFTRKTPKRRNLSDDAAIVKVFKELTE